MSAAAIERPLMDAGEVGLRIGRHRKTVLRMARNDEIGCIPLGARTIRFAEHHVTDYLAEREKPASAKKPARNPRYSK